ncbi:MAG TPA: hypothetical protein V6D20_15615 [Candidatus Obscuribacterales bacterium]
MISELQQLTCFLGIFTVPILAFLLSSVVVSWILQSHLISHRRVSFDDIPRRQLSQIATLSTLAAVPIAISVGMAWFSSICVGELRFDFIAPAMMAPFWLIVRR